MPEILSIDLATQRVCGIQADVGTDSVRIKSSFAFDRPAADDDAAAIGAWLQGELRKVGATAKQLVITLPREDVIVRHMELPDVGDDEMPEIVRFQAASQSTIPMDQLVLDFLPLPQRAGTVGREVLVASVQKDRTERLEKIATSAGLDLTSVGVSSFATAELVRCAEEQFTHAEGDVSLIVARHGNRVELSVVGQASLYFTHSTQVMPGDVQQSNNAILAELSRSLVSLHKQISSAKVVRAWIIGADGEDAALGEAIKDRFRCEVNWLDPFEAGGVSRVGAVIADSHAEFAGPVGFLCAEAAESDSSLDFLNPRKAAVKRDYTNLKRVAVVAAALVLVIAVFAYRGIRVRQLEGEIATATENLSSEKKRLENMKPMIDVTDKVETWADRRVNWLEEANLLATTMQGTEQQYLTKLQFNNGTQKQLGLIEATGHAVNRTPVNNLVDEVLARPGIVSQPNPIDESGRDSDFPYDFELDYTIMKPEEETKQP